MEENEILLQAIATYGENEQSRVAMEELAELIRAINKYHRAKTDEHRQNLIEEMADVYIMLHQISIMYDISGVREIEPVINERLARLRERLEAEDNAENGNT
jgi:NTP pyrophosphatase (non-canonical NTP hydrolase)